MREGIGSTFMYGIIAVFIVMLFAILAGTMSYFKAYKVNNKIISSIEKYEGYNDLAINEIRTQLMSIGYRVDSAKCVRKNGASKVYKNNDFKYCIYLYCDTKDDYKYHYGVTTFISVDIPVIHRFLKIPVYTETNSIHNMSDWSCGS